jgi:hypothetical protein
MASLQTKINHWREAAIISGAQAEQILSFEAARHRFLAGSRVIMLGAIVLSLGLIALISANWLWIPGWLKLTADGLLLALFGYLAWRFYQKPLAFDLLLLFLALLLLASLGLVGQVFHSSSPLHLVAGFWCLMTGGMFIAARRLPVPMLWLAALLFALLSYLKLETSIGLGLITTSLVAALGLLTLALAFILGRDSPQARAAAILFVLGSIFLGLKTEMPILGRYFWGREYILPHWLTAALGLGLALLWLARFYNLRQKIALSLGGLWLLACYRGWFFGDNQESYYSYDIFINPLASFSLLAWLAFYALASDRGYLFLLWLVLAGARFCAIFLIAADGLLETGLYLFLSGLILIAIPLLGKKFLPDKFFPASPAPRPPARNGNDGGKTGEA